MGVVTTPPDSRLQSGSRMALQPPPLGNITEEEEEEELVEEEEEEEVDRDELIQSCRVSMLVDIVCMPRTPPCPHSIPACHPCLLVCLSSSPVQEALLRQKKLRSENLQLQHKIAEYLSRRKVRKSVGQQWERGSSGREAAVGEGQQWQQWERGSSGSSGRGRGAAVGEGQQWERGSSGRGAAVAAVGEGQQWERGSSGRGAAVAAVGEGQQWQQWERGSSGRVWGEGCGQCALLTHYR